MIIKKIVLKNFLSHTDSTIQFNPDGITAIIGENGSGKSSIIEAIQFALFGESEKGNLNQLIKWGKREAVVELEFENSLGLFKIHREIVKTGKTVSSQNSIVEKFENNRFNPYYQKNLRTELPKLIGFTKKTFLTSGLIKQGDIEGLLSVKPSQREAIIEELLGIQYYQKIIDKYKEIRKSIKDRIDILTEKKPDIDLIDQQLKQKEEDLSNIRKKLEELISRLSNANEEKNKIDEQLERFKSIKLKIETKEAIKNRILEDLRKLEEKLSEIHNLKEKLPDIEKNYQEFINLNQKLEKVKEAEKLIIRKNTLIEKLDNINKDIQFLQTFKETAQRYEESKNQLQQLKIKREEISNILNEIEKKEIEKQSLQKQLSQRKEDLAFILSFEEIVLEYEEKQKSLNRILEEINQFSKKKGQIQQLTESIENIEQYLKERKKKLIQISEFLKNSYYQKFQTLKVNPMMIDEFIRQNEFKIQELSKQKENLQKELTELKTEGKLYRQKFDNLSSIEAVCPTCSRPIQQHEKEELISEMKHKLNELREKYKIIEKKVEEVDKELEIQNQIKTHLTEFKNILSSYIEKKQEKEKYIQTLEKYKNENKQLSDLEKEKEIIQKFLQTHNANYGRYKSLKNKSIEEEIKSIEKYIKNIEEFLEENKKEELIKQKENIQEDINLLEQFLSSKANEYVKYSSLDKNKLLKEKQDIQDSIDEIDRQIKESGLTGIYTNYTKTVKGHTDTKQDYSTDRPIMMYLYFSQSFKKMELPEEEKLSSIKEELIQKIESLKDYQNTYYQVTQKIKEEEKIKQDIEKTQQELEKIEKEKKSLESQLSEIDEHSKLLEKENLNKLINQLSEEKDLLNSESIKIQTETENLKLIYEEAKRGIQEIEQLKERLQRYEKVIETLSYINRLIKDNALYMLPKITEEIFNKFNFSGFSGLKLDEKYSIVLPVSYPGVEVDATVDALSGGQRIALALALRFAISYMLNTKLEFLILDEPTIHMDRQRRRELVDLIGDLRDRKFVKQLIIVTHDEEIEERADTIYRVQAGQVELV